MYEVLFTKDGWVVRGNGRTIRCSSASAAMRCAERMNRN